MTEEDTGPAVASLSSVAGADESAIVIAPEARVESPIAALLRDWVTDCIHNSPLARDTDGLNHLITAALPELERRLLPIIAKGI